MQFTSSVRNLSLGLATASFLLAGSAFAQNQQQSSSSTYKLVGVDARLEHALSSKSAKSGEKVVAELNAAAKTPEGVDLPKGTELCGTVDTVQQSQDKGPARISIIFNQAKLKDGKTLPVHVILLGAFPATNWMDSGYGTQDMGPAPRSVPSNESVDQKPGLLHNISMHSDMHGHDSATFIKRNGDFTLRRGTRLQIAIAPRDNGGMSNGA